jgi:hypothetical protein
MSRNASYLKLAIMAWMVTVATALNVSSVRSASHPSNALYEGLSKANQHLVTARKTIEAVQQYATSDAATNEGRRAAINISYTDAQKSQSCTAFRDAFLVTFSKLTDLTVMLFN